MSALTDPSSVEAAETYQRAADCQGLLGDPEGALALLERAVRIFETSPACEGHARALARCERFESALGREEQAAASAAHATQVAGELGDPAVYRATLIIQAMHDGVAGDLHLALSRAQEAASIVPAEPDPLGEVLLAANHTLILGLAGASAEDVAAAGRRGLEAADTCGLDTFPVSILRVNVAMALRHEGQVRRAAPAHRPGHPRRAITGPVVRSLRAGSPRRAARAAGRGSPTDRGADRLPHRQPREPDRRDGAGRDGGDVVRSSRGRPAPFPGRARGLRRHRRYALDGPTDGPGRRVGGRLCGVFAGPSGPAFAPGATEGFGVPVRSEPVRAPSRVLGASRPCEELAGRAGASERG